MSATAYRFWRQMQENTAAKYITGKEYHNSVRGKGVAQVCAVTQGTVRRAETTYQLRPTAFVTALWHTAAPRTA